MRILVWLVVVFVAATIFALSNSQTVTITFWQLPIYTGALSVALIGAGLIGALITFLASLMLQAGARDQLRELEAKVREQNERLAHLPAWAQGRQAPRPPDDTRQSP